MLFLFALCLGAFAGELQVHVLDVGQGDAILLEAANGKRVLVDAGTRHSDIIKQLKDRGVKQLDLVVASHAHADHIGGMAEVIDTFKPKLYVDNSMTHTTLTYSRTMAAVERNDIGYRTGFQGRTFKVDSDLKLTILHPGSKLLSGTRSDLNSNSVVIRVDHEDDCILLTGDAEDPTERVLMQRDVAPCEVLKVAHHGSAHSTSAAWLRAVQPRIALISAGKGNRYKHPARETLARLASADVEVYRTDLQGTLTIISTGKGVTVKGERAPDAQPLDADPAATTPPGVAGPALGSVNINKADASTLDRLPGIGPARAAAILADRKENGPYESCDQLERIRGIGPKTVASLQAQCITKDPVETP